MPDLERPHYPVDDVHEALSGLDEASRELVLSSLERIARSRAEREATSEWLRAACAMMTAYDRVSFEPSNSNNIEGWFERLDSVVGQVLTKPVPSPEYQNLRTNVVQFAALEYIILAVNSGFEEDLDLELLRASQVDEKWLVSSLKFFYKGQDPETGSYQSIDNLEQLTDGVAYCDYAAMKTTEQQIADSVKQLLTADGQTLPVLGDDGLYDDEREYYSGK